MDQRELESRIKALTKCVAANEPAENAIKMLETLKKDAKPTEEMLRVSSFRSLSCAVMGCDWRRLGICPTQTMRASLNMRATAGYADIQAQSLHPFTCLFIACVSALGFY
jgi:hypothetical protein